MAHKGGVLGNSFVEYIVSDDEIINEFEKHIQERYEKDVKKWKKQPTLYEYLKNNPLVDLKEQKEKLKQIKTKEPKPYYTDEEYWNLQMSLAWDKE